MTTHKLPNYFSYLVRLWRYDDQSAWRATLQDPHTGHQLRFETVESLFIFFQKQLGLPAVLDLPPAPDKPQIEQHII